MLLKTVRSSLLAALLAAVLPSQVMAHSGPSVSCDEAITRLEKGNKIYVSPRLRTIPNRIRRAAVAKEQHPFAVIVTCSDSRVAPELVFRQNLGDLFVVRAAGNVVDHYGIGSIQYAVEHLGSRLVVVMGHARCGAVDACVQKAHGTEDINAILKAIRPAVIAAKKEKGSSAPLLERSVKENARLVSKQIAQSKPKLSQLAGGDEVRVIPAYYDLDTGRVTLLE